VEVGPRGASLILADGPLTAGEVVGARLGPGLAVLAGCASAAQLAHRTGREVWGSLAAAFLASGARQVVAALWSIPDDSTRAFVERFYAEGGAEDPAGALARTQRAWIADGRGAEEWAPFVLLGTGTPAPRAR
jgi:CHAT domain-containing protein